MPWDFDNDRFDSPDFDFAPTTFIAQKALELIDAQQSRALTWWNNRWSSAISYTMQSLPAAQMAVGEPLVMTARGLFCIPVSEILAKDNYQEEPAVFNFVYLPGDAQLAGAAAARYSKVFIAGFYLALYASILQSAPEDKFTLGWPAAGTPSHLANKRLRINRPDTKLFPQLVPENGVQSVITLECNIYPEPIYRD